MPVATLTRVAAATVDFVGTYAPSPFGFGKFRKGVRPADHALAKVKEAPDPRD